MGVTQAQIQAANVAKLRERYKTNKPEEYGADRDVKAELQALVEAVKES